MMKLNFFLKATSEPSRKLQMSRGLRKAARDLKRYAREEEKRRTNFRQTPVNPNISKVWGV